MTTGRQLYIQLQILADDLLDTTTTTRLLESTCVPNCNTFFLAAILALAVLLTYTISSALAVHGDPNTKLHHPQAPGVGHALQESRRNKLLRPKARPTNGVSKEDKTLPTLSLKATDNLDKKPGEPLQIQIAKKKDDSTPSQVPQNSPQDVSSPTNLQKSANSTNREQGRNENTKNPPLAHANEEIKLKRNSTNLTWTLENLSMGQNSSDLDQTPPPPPPAVTLPPLILPAVEHRTCLWVHVGKAGGSSFKRMLRRILQCDYNHKMTHDEKQACYDQPLQRKETQISYLIRHQMHMQYKPKHAKTGQDIVDYFSTILFSLRNPWTRLDSAYQYGHPTNARSVIAKQSDDLKHTIYSCFPSLEALGLALAPSDYHDNNNNNCTADLAQQALLHKTLATRRVNMHLYADYQYYLQPIRALIEQQHNTSFGNTTEVWALRMEYLWNDTKRLEQAIGGTPATTMRGMEKIRARVTTSANHDNATTSSLNNNTAINATTINIMDQNSTTNATATAPTTFSTKARQALCCVYLWDELEAYQWIVQRAVNLEPFQRQEAMDEALQSCGFVDLVSSGNVTGTTIEPFDFGPNSYARHCANHRKGERVHDKAAF